MHEPWSSAGPHRLLCEEILFVLFSFFLSLFFYANQLPGQRQISLRNTLPPVATMHLDCSQSPSFSVGLSRLVRFDGAVAILVCKSERHLGRVSKLPRGAEWGLIESGEGKLPSVVLTLPRSRSLLQIKMAAAPSKRTSLDNPTENRGTVNSLLCIRSALLGVQKIPLY